ncbi:hypothetical protein [Streptomyces sp. NPDC051572]|uniref:hypothetical protein n=1 Tax=unclassified Streptomyces TaxID=2593676 RepID=UPI00344B6290
MLNRHLRQAVVADDTAVYGVGTICGAASSQVDAPWVQDVVPVTSIAVPVFTDA